MNKKVIKEVEQNYLSLVRKYLKEFGYDTKKISLDADSLSIEVKPHLLDIDQFCKTANPTKTTMSLLKELKLQAPRNYFEDCPLITVKGWGYVDFESKQNMKVVNIIDDINKAIQTGLANIKTSHLEDVSKIRADLPLEESLLVSEKGAKKLKYNLVCDGDLSNVESWKVKILLGNSMGSRELKVGDLDNVGYVQIGIKTGTIVPIARSDEHHRGLDLISDLINQGSIPKDRYHGIFIHGCYADANDPVALAAFEIWLKHGGKNIVISKWGSSGGDFAVTIKDYVEARGNIELKKGQLHPIGRRFVDGLKSLSAVIQANREAGPVAKDKAVISAANKFAALCDREILNRLGGVEFSHNGVESASKALKLLIDSSKSNLPAEIENFFFGFNGLKNQVHNQLRKAISSSSRFDKRDMEKIFGDLDLANHELGSI